MAKILLASEEHFVYPFKLWLYKFDKDYKSKVYHIVFDFKAEFEHYIDSERDYVKELLKERYAAIKAEKRNELTRKIENARYEYAERYCKNEV